MLKGFSNKLISSNVIFIWSNVFKTIFKFARLFITLRHRCFGNTSRPYLFEVAQHLKWEKSDFSISI